MTHQEKIKRRIPGPEIIRNVRAYRGWKKHRVLWCYRTGAKSFLVRTDRDTNGEVEDAVKPARWDPDHIQPDPIKWIGDIQPGERLVVTPQAMFRLWENYVQKAKMTIHTSCMKLAAGSY